MSGDIEALLAAATKRVEAMTPEKREAMWEAQRQSFARAMAPCEHGVADWEDCVECRKPKP